MLADQVAEKQRSYHSDLISSVVIFQWIDPLLLELNLVLMSSQCSQVTPEFYA